MNLIQIQEHLRDVPTQALLGYANGMNPQVPPYVALNELHRRKRLQESANPAQMPQGTVKDEVAAKAMGLGSIMPGMPPQGPMPQPGQMPGGGMPQPGMVSAAMGAPRPPMPQPGQMPAQPQPQNPAAQPNMRPGPMMAAGGLVGLNPNVPETMFSGGGLVAFAGAGPVGGYAEDEEEPPMLDDPSDDFDEDEEADMGGGTEFARDTTVPIQRGAVTAGAGTGIMANLTTSADKRKERDAAIAQRDAQVVAGRKRLDEMLQQAQPKDPKQAMAEYDAARDERNAYHGVAPGKLGEQLIADNERILQMKEAQDPHLANDNDRRRRIALFDALARTRGTGRGAAGIASALGSFGANINPALEAQIEDEAKLRMLPIQREQLRAQLRAKVDEMRRALADGDLKRFEQTSAEAARLKRALATEVGKFETKALQGYSDMAKSINSGLNMLETAERQGINSANTARINAESRMAAARARAGAGGGGAKGALTEAQTMAAIAKQAELITNELSTDSNRKGTTAQQLAAIMTQYNVSEPEAIEIMAAQRVKARRDLVRGGLGSLTPKANTAAPAPAAAGPRTSGALQVPSMNVPRGYGGAVPPGMVSLPPGA